MSRIGVMTFLHNGNYGSTLQAYALQRVLRDMGHECEHIDYQPDRWEKSRNFIVCGNHPKLLIEGRQKRKVLADEEAARQKRASIHEFYESRMQLSPACRNHRELAAICGRYDLLMCGSDQIWNPTWLNPAYFLDFAPPEMWRVAYAPSLGVSVAPGRRKSRMIREMTELFDSISVREEEGARVMVTITGQRPPVTPDPVCLLTKEEWTELAGETEEREPYLLCYFIGENPSYWERVGQISKETGLRPMIIPVTEEAFRREEEKWPGVGPVEFLRAIAGADMICTDSFHGLAFGTIFEKRIELCRRYRDEDRDSKNSRVDHFIREVKTSGLEKMRETGLEWLREATEK